MAIDISACKSAITRVKSNIDKCFTACDSKGSTYTQSANTTSELINKINGISGGSGGSSSIGQAFSGFGVSYNNNSSVTIDCGSIGASWRGITIYSNTKQGWFSIYKISSNICIMSANPWYATVDDPVLDNGNFPYNIESSSYRCLYSVSGNSITLTVSTYVGQDSSTDISVCADQISSNSSYMLDTIDIIT